MLELTTEGATDTLIDRVLLAVALLPDSPNRDLLREALFATASARNTPQLRLRLSLLSSLIIDCFRTNPAVAIGLLEDVEGVLDS
jgi:hypothetical protein